MLCGSEQQLGAALTRAERLGFGTILRRAQIFEAIAENRAKVQAWLAAKEAKIKKEANERRRQRAEIRSKEAEEVRRKVRNGICILAVKGLHCLGDSAGFETSL